MPQDQEIVWHVLTHEHKTHATDWYWAVGLLTLVGAGLSVYLGNLLLAIILLLGAGSIVFLKIRGPREHQVKLDMRGATLDGTIYPWKSLHSFWVFVDDERAPRVYLTTRSFLTPRLVLPLKDRDHAVAVRTFLRQYVQEEEQQPHMGEHLAEILGL